MTDISGRDTAGHHGLQTARRIHELRRFAVDLARRLARGRVDPDDLAQDALERWWRLAGSGARIISPQAWMQVVLRHLLIDELRHRRACPLVPRDDIDQLSTDRDSTPRWEVDVCAVDHEIGNLPPALRDTFQLFAFESRSYKQIAEQLNIAMGTVGVRISRARARLRRQLSKRHSPAFERS